MQEELLGYLLGALDGPEQDRVREQLDCDAELRREISDLELRLAPLQRFRWEVEAPGHLAATTCALVARHADPREPRLFQPGERDLVELPAGGTPRFRRVDVTVAAGILLMLGLLVGPALLNSREHSRIMACQDNLRLFGIALPTWADRVQGWLPHIPASGNTGVAGFYAPQLVTCGLMTEHPRFVCPSSRLTEWREQFRVPSTNEVYLAKGAQLAEMQQTMGGSYAYGLGFLQNSRLMGRRLAGRSSVAIMADHPTQGANAEYGHLRGGINVLYEDGHVRFVPTDLVRGRTGSETRQSRKGPGDWRELFLSDRGIEEAGVSEDDVVLAASWVRPVPPELARHLMSEVPADLDAILRSLDYHAINVGSVLLSPRQPTYLPWQRLN